MNPASPRHSRIRRAAVTVAAIALAGAGLAAPAAAATSANPYSPAYGHSYRHGVTPTTETQAKMHSYRITHPASHKAGANLTYGGGVDGIGVTTGAEKVYMVIWGSQWGTAGTNGSGNTTMTGDPSGEVPYLESMYKGLGTNGERWSNVMTQYCEGIPAGSQSCPGTAPHVAYPGNGVFAGIYVDNSVAAPTQETYTQIGQEAVKAAGHFGNTTPASNRNAQYIVMAPHNTFPDGFNNGGGFCAWHDWNGDLGVSSPYGDIALTNSPYITDAGASCGQGFVNFPGTLDGVSIVNGHEYSETITDQNPAGGWLDSSGEENADKCSWLNPGATGGAGNLSLATGTFAMQGTWGNDTNNCEFTR